MNSYRPIDLWCLTWICASCSSGPALCTGEAEIGLAVRVVNGANNSAICDAKVIVANATYQEQLQPTTFDEGCVYILSEHAGTYTVTVARDGFVPSTPKPATVLERPDGCHVVASSLTIT